MLARGLSDLSQLRIGWFTEALPDQPHDPLQQSQYRVVLPDPLCALTVAAPVVRARKASCLSETSIVASREWFLRELWRGRKLYGVIRVEEALRVQYILISNIRILAADLKHGCKAKLAQPFTHDVYYI